MRRKTMTPVEWGLLCAIACAGLVGAGAANAQAVARQAASPAISADELLSVSSVVGGRDEPVWDADGSHVTFLGSFGGPLGIWSVPAAGGPAKLLVRDVSLSGMDYTAGQRPVWSPRGDYLAYVTSKGGDAPEIWLWSPRTGTDLQLTHMGGGVYSMNWSPDGLHIAFAGDRYGSENIYTVSVPRGNVLRLTSDPRYEVFPTWTPDSRTRSCTIGWTIGPARRHGGNRRRLDPAAARGAGERTSSITGAAQRSATPVSPDGAQVLFLSQRAGGTTTGPCPFGGGTPRRRAESAEQSEATWSPDGKGIAYVSNRNGTMGSTS